MTPKNHCINKDIISISVKEIRTEIFSILFESKKKWRNVTKEKRRMQKKNREKNLRETIQGI